MANSAHALRISDSQDHASLPGEIWKPVPSEPGLLASSKGRVLLPPRYCPMHNGGFRASFPKPVYGVIARASKAAKHSYRQVMVRRDGDPRQAPRKVHQLVCEAFHGSKPFPEAVVIHMNEDAHDNRPENLKWGTQKENLNAPKYLKWKKSIKGEAHHGCKYSDATIQEIRARSADGVSRRKLMKEYGLSSGSLSDILNNRRRPAPEVRA